MAKYVGKVFKIPNNKLKIKGDDIHPVYVEWFNPKSKMFKCKVVTSLEEVKNIKPQDRETILSNNLYYKLSNGNFALFHKKKYKKIRDGVITPIPSSKIEGTEVWHGFQGVKMLDINTLKNATKHNFKIKK